MVGVLIPESFKQSVSLSADHEWWKELTLKIDYYIIFNIHTVPPLITFTISAALSLWDWDPARLFSHRVWRCTQGLVVVPVTYLFGDHTQWHSPFQLLSFESECFCFVPLTLLLPTTAQGAACVCVCVRSPIICNWGSHHFLASMSQWRMGGGGRGVLLLFTGHWSEDFLKCIFLSCNCASATAFS